MRFGFLLISMFLVGVVKGEVVEHREVLKDVKGFGELEFEEGKRLYTMVCAACHGDGKGPVPVPNARNLHQEKLLNGSDAASLYRTLTKGFNQMPAQTGLSAEERYYVIEYLRKGIFMEENESQFVELTDAYIASVPAGEKVEWDFERKKKLAKAEEFDLDAVDYGRALFGHFEASINNLVPKGVIIGLGGDGVNGAGHYALYDLDTGRLVSFSSGKLLDWQGIEYDGGHRTHARLSGKIEYEAPSGLAWAKPSSETPGRHPDFRDPREEGLNGRKYGPVPNEYFDYKGMVMTMANPALHYRVGDAEIVEMPSVIEVDGEAVYVRSYLIKAHKDDLFLRTHAKFRYSYVKADRAAVRMKFGGTINEGIVDIPAHGEDELIHVIVNKKPKEVPADLWPKLTWPEMPSAESAKYVGRMTKDDAKALSPKYEEFSDLNGFRIEKLELAQESENPWNTRIRPSGVDFLGDDVAVMSSWSGGVYLLDGIEKRLGGAVRLSRIAAGLHQPLGVKVRDGEVFIGCRDQIMRLHDYDGDAVADYYEAFNSDHTLSMHFHEFAGGLDTDKDGNFYYVKCGHHAGQAFFKRHGTLIKVSKDGERSEILANGLRSSNGCFVDDDGSVWVTDQEGFWNPQNKITRVELGKFHGNMLGYHDPEKISPRDEDMVEPMVWLPKEFANSPSEVFRFPKKGWGGLSGTLGYFEYGNGVLVTLPYEEKDGQLQGLADPIATPQFNTGIMRGRFHGKTQELYACGLFGWGSSRVQTGGFYRVAYSGEGAYAVTGFETDAESVTLRFSDPLDGKMLDVEDVKFTSYTIERSARYGAKLEDEVKYEVGGVEFLEDGKSVKFKVAGLKKTRVLYIDLKLEVKGEVWSKRYVASIYKL